MMGAMEQDQFCPFPAFPGGLPAGGAGSAGDNVLYSTRSYVSSISGRPRDVGPLQADEINKKVLSGSYTADQASTLKWQQWDQASATWVTLNNNGSGDTTTANNPMNFVLEKVGGGDWQIIVNFAVAPSVWKHTKKVRLSRTS